MKTLVTLILALFALSSMAADCNKEAVLSSLNKAKLLVPAIRECETLDCITQKSRPVEKKLCEAAEACPMLTYELYNPCNQQVVIKNPEDNKKISIWLSKLIKRGNKEMEGIQ